MKHRSLPEDDFATLVEVVQANCNISDARNAGDFTLCTYLLKMREFYRWETGAPFGQCLDREAVGQWLRQREALWEDIEDQEFNGIPVDTEQFHPFDSHNINDGLTQHGLVYSGGYGLRTSPHFFLGELLEKRNQAGFDIYIAGKEYARDLSAPPAMTQGTTIYIRHESLRRFFWEKIDEWRWNRPDNAMKRALDYYDFDDNLDEELEALTLHEIDNVILHEIGEARASGLLGDAWNEMLMALPKSQTELKVRAVRDHLADCTTTLPTLIENEQEASIHFYFGNFKTMRKEIFPSLMEAYNAWHLHADKNRLASLVEKSADHWGTVARLILDEFARHGEAATKPIEKIIQENIL